MQKHALFLNDFVALCVGKWFILYFPLFPCIKKNHVLSVWNCIIMIIDLCLYTIEGESAFKV